MRRFYESLTNEERLLLEHMSMQYLDRVLPENWSENSERVDYQCQIGSEQVTVQGFAKPNFDVQTFRIREGELPFSMEVISSLASLANHRPERQNSNPEHQQPSYGALLSNQQAGNHVLFDHSVKVQHAVSLDFSDAEINGRMGGPLEPGEESSIRGRETTCKVVLAPEQFVRFVRGNAAAVPCTISRRAGYMHDDPPMDHLNSVKQAKNVREAAEGAAKELVKLAARAAEMMESGKVTSSKRFDELEAVLDEIEAAYKDVFGEVRKVQEDAVASIQENYLNRMIDQVEREIQALPESQRGTVLALMNSMGQDL